jgi:hypothetical protein
MLLSRFFQRDWHRHESKDGSSGNGGAGGVAPAERRRLRFPTALISGTLYNNDTGRVALGGGSGGGGGGGDGVNAGGGGEGARLIAIWAQAVVNNGTFSAKGGNGAEAPAVTPVAAAGA